jgi:hypothetical protein
LHTVKTLDLDHQDGSARSFETISADRRPPVKTIHETEFPEQDESVGELMISFAGPSLNEHAKRKVSVPLSF